jgi:RNA polymerase sigma factor (sigma-70 family)
MARRHLKSLPATDAIEGAGTTTHDPKRLQQWTEFHEKVDQLPAPEKEMWNLLWYLERSKEEVATLLGISERTVHRRWLEARLHLKKLLDGELPR